MADSIETKKKNWIFIIGVLIMCVGMQVANYGTAVCLTGEMNSMAKDVENLNRMFSNVKVRGTWGEIQAESILSDILTPQQYVKNYAPGRSARRPARGIL